MAWPINSFAVRQCFVIYSTQARFAAWHFLHFVRRVANFLRKTRTLK